jgi:hypothetical protein
MGRKSREKKERKEAWKTAAPPDRPARMLRRAIVVAGLSSLAICTTAKLSGSPSGLGIGGVLFGSTFLLSAALILRLGFLPGGARWLAVPMAALFGGGGGAAVWMSVSSLLGGPGMFR